MHTFVGRSLSTSDKAKIDELATTLGNLGREINEGYGRQTAKTVGNIDQNVDRVLQIVGETSKNVDVPSKRASSESI